MKCSSLISDGLSVRVVQVLGPAIISLKTENRLFSVLSDRKALVQIRNNDKDNFCDGFVNFATFLEFYV